jgi:hypothetical protein
MLLLALFLLGSPFLVSSNASSSATQGYVTYQVTLKTPTNQTSFVVNESSVPTSQSGFVNLTLDLVSNFHSLTYSRILNTSSLPEIFPFIPGITNQSLSYQTHGILISAQITSSGTSSVNFGGTTYSVPDYLVGLSATNSSSGQTISVNGIVLAMPSGLLYSATFQKAGNSGSALSIQLVATNLPLNDPTNSASTAEGAAMVGAGLLGAAAIAVPWKLGKKKVSAATTEGAEKKPSYWVD